MDVLAPDEAIVPVIVTVILVGLVGGVLWLGGIVATGGGSFERDGCGEDGRALVEVKRDEAFEMDGVAGVSAGGEVDGAAAGLFGFGDGGIDGRCVDGGAVAFGAVCPYVKDGADRGGLGRGLAAVPRLMIAEPAAPVAASFRKSLRKGMRLLGCQRRIVMERFRSVALRYVRASA